MSTNLSKTRREKMIESLKEIRKLIDYNPEMMSKISEIENELNKKKYGLIWEEHEENVDKQIKTQIPIFIENKELEIKKEDNKPINFLIEGDNLHSLYLLKKTHKEKIDVIYIDPPYNTGNKDFVYDDNIIDVDDGFKHSKWISFMEKRLKISQELLTENGVIFISIDDNEYSQLKLLCDGIFGENNFIANFIRKTGSTRAMAKHFDIRQDYVLIYSKNKLNLNLKQLENIKVEKYKNYDNDIKGAWDTQDLTVRSGGYEYSIPSIDNTKTFKRKWRYSLENLKQKMGYYKNDSFKEIYKSAIYIPEKKWYVIGEFVFKGKDKIINHKKYADKTNTLTNHTLYENIGSNKTANALLKKMIGNNEYFNNPKPIELLKYLIYIASQKDSIILDFFAGSGTTGHAVLELNNEDNGNRKFILCTNNENNICTTITYDRIKKVITGYADNKGINANLKYYKTEYIDRFNSYDNDYYITQELSKYIKELVQLENGIDEKDPTIQIIFTDEELDNFLSNKDMTQKCKLLYLDRNAMIDGEHDVELKKNNIQICYIPEYYFENEIMEAEEW